MKTSQNAFLIQYMIAYGTAGRAFTPRAYRITVTEGFRYTVNLVGFNIRKEHCVDWMQMLIPVEEVGKKCQKEKTVLEETLL